MCVFLLRLGVLKETQMLAVDLSAKRLTACGSSSQYTALPKLNSKDLTE